MPDGTTFIPAETAKAARLVRSLGLMYLRHGDSPRALALGLAAMKSGPIDPPVTLLVAQAFLRIGDAEQAAAALTRFEKAEAAFTQMPSLEEQAAALILRAKIAVRQGDTKGAADLLAQSNEIRAGAPE